MSNLSNKVSGTETVKQTPERVHGDPNPHPDFRILDHFSSGEAQSRHGQIKINNGEDPYSYPDLVPQIFCMGVLTPRNHTFYYQKLATKDVRD